MKEVRWEETCDVRERNKFHTGKLQEVFQAAFRCMQKNSLLHKLSLEDKDHNIPQIKFKT